MRRFLITVLLVVLAALPLRAQDDDDFLGVPPSEPSCFNGKVRVSALIANGAKIKVGLVETASKAVYLVSPGEFAGEVEVLAADYEKETVTLRLGDQTCTLKLASAPNAVPSASNQMPPETVYRGEAIEKFLKEHPNAIKEGMVKFPPPIAHAAVGRGEGIENALKAHPEIKLGDDVLPGRQGSGIEDQMRQHPEFLTNAPAGIPPTRLR